MKNSSINFSNFFLAFVIFLLSTGFAKAQTVLLTDPAADPAKNKNKEIKSNEKLTCAYTNKQRYKIDYEIKNVATPTVAQIEAIDLLKIENHRKDSRSVEVLDTNTGQTIILYSIVEAMKRESESKIVIDFVTKLYFVEQ